MGLTAHNRKRREMEAQGGGGQLIKAQAHYDQAVTRCKGLELQYRMAEGHLATMAAALVAAQPKANKKPAAKKVQKKKGKKPAAKKEK